MTNFAFDSDDDNSDERIQLITCAMCKATFNSNEKGVSILKSQCVSCCRKSRLDMLAALGESEVDDNSELLVDESAVPQESGSSILSPERGNKDEEGNEMGSILHQFNCNEDSFTVNIGGYNQTYCRKKFISDGGSSVKCFLDLEMLSMIPLLFNYYVLSAVLGKDGSYVNYSRCWVSKNSDGKQYVVLCYLRTKCNKWRCDSVLYDPTESGKIFLLTGLSKMKQYTFLPEVSLDHDWAKSILETYLRDPKNKLAWDPQGDVPNKDETGNWILDGWDPVEEGLKAAFDLSSKKRLRKRKASVRFADENFSSGTGKKPRKKANKPSQRAVAVRIYN